MSKFSEELIAVQTALLLFTFTIAAYLLLVRKKKKESAEWVPAALVRAYLDRIRADEREARLKLFGEKSPAYSTSQAPLSAALSGSASADPGLLKEIEALRSQLTLADQRTMEFDRMMNGLRAEKTALEQKLKEAPAAGAGAAAPAGDSAVVQKELEDLKARLQEYEVIEDDLANLKKFQKENEQLKQKVQQYEGGGATVTTISGTPAPAASTMVVSGGGEKSAPAMTLVSGGNAAPAEEIKVAASVAASEPAPAPVSDQNTNVLQPVTPSLDDSPAPAAAPAAAADPAAPEKSAQQKEEELLSEFEKMLAS
jgi:hypothetical protein